MDKNLEKQLEKKMYEVLRAYGPLTNSDFYESVSWGLDKPIDQIGKILEKLQNTEDSDKPNKTRIEKIKQNVSERQFNRKLKELYYTKGRKVDWLKRYPESWGIGKDAWYYFSGQEQLLEQKLGITLYKIPYESKLRHSNTIKKEIIQPWLDQVSSKEICKNLPIPPFDYIHKMNGNYQLIENLSVEENVLFSDLKNHLKFEDPIEKLKAFKEKSKQFLEIEKKIIEDIKTIISNEIDIKQDKQNIPEWICCVIYSNLFRYHEINNEVAKTTPEFNYFTSSTAVFYKDQLLYSVEPPYEERPKIKNYESSNMSLDILIKKPYTKEKVDKILENLPNKVNEQKEIIDKIKALIQIKQELIKCFIDMKKSLEQHKKMPILPGYCDFI